MRPASRHKNDASAAADTNWRRFRGEPWPAGLELQWLGTAGFRISYAGAHLYVDPYLTRSALGETLLARPLRPREAVVARHVPAADAVLVGHTHFDHALDLAPIARRTGCAVFGSRSVANLLAAHGLADRARVVEPYRTYDVGPFAVTFVPSLHSKLVLGLRVPFDGELTCDHLDDLTAPAYRCGDVYGIHIAVAGVTFYHQGSANLIDDAIVHRGVDYFLCGLAGRGFTRNYVARILRRLEPRVIVPHHHDNFFRPLDAPMGFSLRVNYAGFLDEVRAVSADFAVRSLDLLQTRTA
ncbi:MAG: MBL fold metallo-hydrolase [Deltaproteobacteria bacterium]|nr:MAG: MBL fold metallo-hydrolase [Deltaproteobacteria bacterium]